MNLILYDSQRSRQLRFDIRQLEQSLQEIAVEIATFHQAQYAFEREYQNRLGEMAEAVVRLRVQLGMADSSPQHKEAITILAEPEQQQLKMAYRQAAKLCHPDTLSDAQREEGLALFDCLNKAYRLQNLVQVEHILWLLQSGQAFNQCPIVIISEDLLSRRVILLKQLITQQQDNLAQLKMCEDYDVSNPDNWNILLYDYQIQLEDELAMLRGRVAHNNKQL